MESGMRPGTYRGIADGMTFEFRVDVGADGAVRLVSGDITREGEFVASFQCTDPRRSDGEGTVEGSITFRGNDRLFTGHLKLQADDRGIGAFEVRVDMQGGHPDPSVGRVEWQGEYLRRILIEIDGIEGTEPPPEFVGAGGRRVSIERAFRDAGFDVTVDVDPFRGRGPDAARVRGFTPAEIHTAMQELRSTRVSADGLHVHVFVCSYLAEDRDTLGLMYDWGPDDLNLRPREGVAVFYDHAFLSDPRFPEDQRRREYVFTAVHEIGHALNLLHSFDKARPASLSWMNYPQYFPYGLERPHGYDGAAQFWQHFPEAFDDEELRHLRHGSPREVAAGGFAFGVYEEGVSWAQGGAADPRRTVLGANPLRGVADVNLTIGTHKREYELGEPVFLRVEVKNAGTQLRLLPKALDPAEGYLKLSVRRPDGTVLPYRPPLRFCKQAQMVAAPPGAPALVFDGAPIFLSASGPVFTEPGTYLLQADLTGVDGSRVVQSRPVPVRVAVPDRKTEHFAERSWTDARQGLRALYLRHPLALKSGFEGLEELARVTGLDQREGNTTWSYLNFIAAMGWLTPFAPPHGRHQKEAVPEKARGRIHAVREDDLSLLPGGVRRRRGELLADEGTDPRRALLVRLRPRERARAAVPPAGLFGTAGLEGRAEGVTLLDPFKRVVPSLRGTRAFADVVSWNIEHLHDEARWEKIPRVAELIRSFRCDVWGLQEVDRASLAELVNAINSAGRTRYAFEAVEGEGQQNGLLYRTDTTRVRVLEPPPELFGGELKVKLSGGRTVTRPVFHRPPLLADVRVMQQGGTFDFRCAVVHLKSTDSKLADTGSALRAAAAEALAAWIARDRESGSERDYLVLGDMNAETVMQGLGPFSEENGLSLLSVGMRDRYGEQALTRVASGRFLDHIVVTRDAVPDMPPNDLAEQLVVRVDTELGAFTKEYSDHVPVAVRFVLGEDGDGAAVALAARLSLPNGLLAFEAEGADVQAAVLHTLAVMSGVPLELLRREHTLAVALGMTGPKRRALAQPFQTIARRSNPGVAVAPGECEALKTVGEAIDFVAKKATPA